MDAAQWSDQVLEFSKKPMEDLVHGNNTSTTITNNNINNNKRNITTKVSRPPADQTLNCPRCNSTNTKFCYYNNYSMTQPRYFCKTCRRYWTHGGSLRNVPVGGGSRKNKRSSSSSAIITTSLKRNPNPSSSSNSTISNIQIPHDFVGSPALSFLMGYEPITTSMGGGVYNHNSFAANVDHHGLRPSSSSLSFPEMDPSLCGMQLGFQENHENERLLFPFEHSRQVSSSSAGATNVSQEIDRQGEDPALGFWGGMIGGNGASW